MERRIINTLYVSDDDLNCDCEKTTIENLNIGSLNFLISDMEKFDMVIYIGKRGTKIIKSKYTKTGIVGN